MQATPSTFDEPGALAASTYFGFLARHFPVMCASDEFHFLPRAGGAVAFYDCLDDLDAKTVYAVIAHLKGLVRTFAQQAAAVDDFESYIDFKLLQSNATGIIIELEQNQGWRHNPLLYLKIAAIGLDQALNKPAESDRERLERSRARLSAVPRLFRQAMANLNRIPQTHYDAALAMLTDVRQYLTLLGQDLNVTEFRNAIETALKALGQFHRFVKTQVPWPDVECAVSSLEASLEGHFLSGHAPEGIYQMALDAWHQNLEELDRLAQRIDPSQSWRSLYHAFNPGEGLKMDTLSLYRREIDRLRSFFSGKGFRAQDLKAPLELAATPLYLQSIRSSASFSAALRRDANEKSFFYITLPTEAEEKGENYLLYQRLHREYKYLAAHETIPGHHVLDAFRRCMPNPVRRQIESPLFYEGWATYVESLLVEQGYITAPIEILVDYKRRLWRCARCLIDVGLPTRRLKPESAVDLLVQTGFAKPESRRQVARFQLNPGYQLCYFFGRSEIMRLRSLFEKHGTTEQFHTFLLEGGQLPFSLIEKGMVGALKPTGASTLRTPDRQKDEPSGQKRRNNC